MDVLKLLGRRIKQLREERGLTQERFEEISGINARYLSALERGTKNATVEVLQRVAKGLEVQLLSLFLFEGDDERGSRQAIKKLLDELPKDQLGRILRMIAVLAGPTRT